MKDLRWNAIFKRGCNGVISVTLKVKYKKASYTAKVPDIKMLDTVDDYDKQLKEGLKEAFGKEKGKKILDLIFEDFSEI